MAIRSSWIFLLALLYIQAYKDAFVRSLKPSNEQKKEILSGYNGSIPPPQTGADLDFWIFCYVQRIKDFDERKAVLTLEITTFMTWRDRRLTWNITLEDGRQSNRSSWIDVNRDLLWKPQMHFFHRAQPDEILGFRPAYIRSYGMVVDCLFRIVHVACTPHMRWFPFDKHQCSLEVGTWNLQGDVLSPVPISDRTENWTTTKRYQRPFVILRRLTENPRWIMEDVQDQLRMYSELEGFNIPLQTATLFIRRRGSLIALAILCPSVLSLGLGLSSYWLQPGQASRIALPVTASLVVNYALDTVQTLVGSGKGETPFISDLCATCLILLLLSCLHSLLVSFLIRLTSDPPPLLAGTVRRLPNRLLRFWGLDPEPVDLYSEDEGGLLQDWPLKTKLDWADLVGLFDGLGVTVHFVALLVLVITVMITE